MSEERIEVRKGEKKRRKVNPLGVLGVLVIAGLAVAVFVMYNENAKLRDPNYATEQAANEARNLKDKVGKLMALPDEEATVATVQDASKLSEQEFFKGSQNGDKVLIFTAAKRAVIYRESENKIINTGPIVINSTDVEGADKAE